MINITYKKKLKITHIWFCENKKHIKSNGDIIFLHGYGSKNTNGTVSLQHTLVTNLESTKEELWQGISKNVRYEVRRAKKEEIFSDKKK